MMGGCVKHAKMRLWGHGDADGECEARDGTVWSNALRF